MECSKVNSIISAINEERNIVLAQAEKTQSKELYQRAGELKAVISIIKTLGVECDDCDRK